MEQKISQQVSIHKLDYRLNPTDTELAPYQLEIYHTKKQPDRNIGAISENTGTFSYKVGDKVSIAQKVTVNKYLFLKNIILNESLSNYLKTK